MHIIWHNSVSETKNSTRKDIHDYVTSQYCVLIDQSMNQIPWNVVWNKSCDLKIAIKLSNHYNRTKSAFWCFCCYPDKTLLIPIPRISIPDPEDLIPDLGQFYTFDPWSHIPRYDPAIKFAHLSFVDSLTSWKHGLKLYISIIICHL